MTDDIGLSVTLNFDTMGPIYAWVQLTEMAKTLPNLNEYVLSPEYMKNEDGSFTVTGYSFIHRSQVPTEEQWKKYGDGSY